MPIVIAAMLGCPLLYGGALGEYPYHSEDWRFFGFASYSVYVSNPSPFDYTLGGVEFIVKDENSFRGIDVPVAPTVVPANKSIRVTGIQLPGINARYVVGGMVHCKGIKE